MSQVKTDILIVGGGPAGLAAGLYTARDRNDTIILDKYMPGGQINLTEKVENYPGVKEVAGFELGQILMQQAQGFGADIKIGAEAQGIKKLDDGMIEVDTGDNTYVAKIVILAPGSAYRHLGVPGEEKFTGTGVSYCGTCDAPFFKDKHVIAVGGGNTALEDTMHLAKFASKVTLCHRRNEFRATKIIVEELIEEAKKGIIDIRYDTVIETINGENAVQSATLKNVKTNETEELPCDGVFVFVGMVPSTGFLKGSIDLDDHGFIKCDPAYLRTNMPGVFVAGDCRVGAAMQLATAIGDGVATAIFMKEYLRDPSWWQRDNFQSQGY
ncbi:MAG: FAD-dependent oxidoreductase [Phycisphaerae bacterium]|nr:FAD-dependent oxidoreductase [Phycisphaerae bacterium]